jgi:hypothetical protein
MLRKQLALAFACTAVAVSAVGASSAAAPLTPASTDTASAAIGRVANALKTKGCSAELKALFFSGFGAIPTPGCDYLRKSFGTFEKPKGAVYGTGAVVEGLNGNADDYTSAVMVLDKDRKFHIVFLENSGFLPTTKTLFMTQFDASFRIGIDALRRGDCTAFKQVAHLKLGLGAGADAQVCPRIQTSSLGKLLKAEPKAASKRLGGNSNYGFYGIRFKHGGYWTVVMAQQPPSVKIPKSAQYAFIAGYPGPS